MTRISYSLVLLAMLLTAAAAAQTKPATQPSNTVGAHRIWRLNTTEDNIRTAERTLLAVDRSAIIAAIAETVGLSPDQAEKVVSSTIDRTRHEIELKIDLHGETRMVAAEAADHVRRALEKAINEDQDQQRRMNIQDLSSTKATLTLKSKQLRDELAKLQQEVATGSIHELLHALQTQRETVEIDLAAKEARSDALAEQVAKFSDEIQRKVKDDAVARELEKVVQFKQEALDRSAKLQQEGSVSRSQLMEAMALVAEANAKLLERRETAARSAGGDVVAAWNREMMNLAVDRAELNVRSKVLKDKVERYKEVAAEVDYKAFQIDEHRSNLAELSKRLNDIDSQLMSVESAARRERVTLIQVSSRDEPATATQPAK